MAPVLDKKSPGAYQCQLRIFLWNHNGIHIELLPLEDLLEATNVDVVYQIEFYSAFKQTNNNIHTYINIHTERAGNEVMLLI